MTITFFATPVSPLPLSGFFFSSYETFESRMEVLNEEKNVDDANITFITSDNKVVHAYFKKESITQDNFEDYINYAEEMEDMTDQELEALAYLINDIGYSMEDAMSKYDEVNFFSGYLREYAEEYYEECYSRELTALPPELTCYIDYEKIGSDMEANGDVVEINCGLYVTNASEF